MGKTCLRNKEEGLSGATREASQGGQLLSAEGEHGVRGTGWSGGQAMGSGSCLACAVGKEGGVCVCACLCVQRCVCVCVSVCAEVCVCMCACVCVCAHLCPTLCSAVQWPTVCVCVCVCVRAHACVRVCVRVRACAQLCPTL